MSSQNCYKLLVRQSHVFVIYKENDALVNLSCLIRDIAATIRQQGSFKRYGGQQAISPVKEYFPNGIFHIVKPYR